MWQGRLILNSELPAGRTPAPAVAAQLRRDINRMKSEFYDVQSGRVDYDAMRGSEAYRQYVADTGLLRQFDLETLQSREEKLAFWINLYNTLVIHGIIELDLHQSVKEYPDFFRKVSYQIGDAAYAPDDIEHGILRGNKRPPYSLFHPFGHDDRRLAHVVAPAEPRIHFTLVCASSSCPAINVYGSEELEEQLDLAARAFVNGPEVQVLPAKNRLQLSPIFKWYQVDFGHLEGVIDTLIRYRDPGEGRDFLIQRGLAAEIEWNDYDWRLNQ